MKILKELSGAYSSKVELVEIDGVLWVRKTADSDDIDNEKKFFEILARQDLPVLKILDLPELKPNQLLIEYVPHSPTLSGHLNKQTCRLWGQIMTTLHSVRNESAAKYSKGNFLNLDWGNFIDERITNGIEKNRRNKTDLPIHDIERVLAPLRSYIPSKFSLIHGDAHCNNVLVRDNTLYLFDKNSIIFYGDPLFDLALTVIEFPNGLYVHTERKENKNDHLLLNSFLEGYGEDVITDHRPIFDLYVLLRAFSRFPNAFEPHLSAIIKNILSTYL